MKLTNSAIAISLASLAACGTDSNTNQRVQPTQPRQTETIVVTQTPPQVTTPEVTPDVSAPASQTEATVPVASQGTPTEQTFQGYDQPDVYLEQLPEDDSFESASIDDVYADDYYQTLNQEVNHVTNYYYQPTTNRYQPRYLAKPYVQHRRFLSYQPSFNRVRPGYGKWNPNYYNRTKTYFQRSRQWVDRDIYNLCNRTLQYYSAKQYHSRNGYDRHLRHAIQNRDHRGAIRYHDELVRESRYQNGRGHSNQYDYDRDRDQGRDRDRGNRR